MILILLFSTPSFSQTLILPKGKMIDNHRAFTLREFKIILHIYADYLAYFGELPLKDEHIHNLYVIQDKLAQQLSLQSKTIKALQIDRNKIYKRWIVVNKRMHLAENRPNTGHWIAWSLASVLICFFPAATAH